MGANAAPRHNCDGERVYIGAQARLVCGMYSHVVCRAPVMVVAHLNRECLKCFASHRRQQNTTLRVCCCCSAETERESIHS